MLPSGSPAVLLLTAAAPSVPTPEAERSPRPCCPGQAQGCMLSANGLQLSEPIDVRVQLAPVIAWGC